MKKAKEPIRAKTKQEYINDIRRLTDELMVANCRLSYKGYQILDVYQELDWLQKKARGLKRTLRIWTAYQLLIIACFAFVVIFYIYKILDL